MEELRAATPPPSAGGWTTRPSAPAPLARRGSRGQEESVAGAQEEGEQESGLERERERRCVIPTLVGWMRSVKWGMIIQETQDQSVLVRKFKDYNIVNFYSITTHVRVKQILNTKI